MGNESRADLYREAFAEEIQKQEKIKMLETALDECLNLCANHNMHPTDILCLVEMKMRETMEFINGRSSLPRL